MKKISLKSIKEGLKRDEMRNIRGGSGNGACMQSGWLCLRDNQCCSWKCRTGVTPRVCNG